MTDESGFLDEAVTARAAQWHLRIEGDAMTPLDWQTFTEWLDAAPLHARAYREIVDADDDLVAFERYASDKLRPSAANDDPGPSRRGFLLWGPVAAAAAVFAAVMFWPSKAAMEFETYTTAARETQTIDVTQGVRVELNGSTQVDVARADQPLVRLRRGQAAFLVETRQRGAIRVEAGDVTLVDDGTVFDVIRYDGLIRVAVAEGKVIANPGGEAIALAAGQALHAREGSGTIERYTVDAAAVSGWRQGHLSFTGTDAATVAADLGRNLGVTIGIAPGIAGRQLTGVVQLTGEPAQIVGEAAALLGGKARRDGEGWVIAGN